MESVRASGSRDVPDKGRCGRGVRGRDVHIGRVGIEGSWQLIEDLFERGTRNSCGRRVYRADVVT